MGAQAWTRFWSWFGRKDERVDRGKQGRLLSRPPDCVGDAPDGRAICFQRQPAPIHVDPCEDGADQTTHQRAWCQAGGGSYAGQFADPQCPNFTPYNEEDISQRSASFGLNLTNAPCAVVSDTGWNATYAGTNFCNG